MGRFSEIRGRYSLNVCIASWTSSILVNHFFQTEAVFLIIN